MTALERFGSALNGAQLRTFLAGQSTPSTRGLDLHIDLGPLKQEAAALEKDRRVDPATDAVFAPRVYETFRSLPRRHLLDHRFWQWVTCVEFRDYTRARWAPEVDFTVDSTLKPSQQARFLGNAGLNGLGRNAISRLYWAADVMGDADEDYVLTRALFKKQDLAVGVVERSFGLIPAVARACARHLADVSEEEHREALKRLNLRSSTVVLEGASEEQVRDLLRASE